MRVAVATEGNEVAAHFGRCPEYTLFDVVDGRPTGRETVPNPGHEPGLLPGFLATKNVNVIIAGGMGPRAQGLFSQHGITTVVGVAGPVDEAVRFYLDGSLEIGQSQCDHGSGEHDGCQG